MNRYGLMYLILLPLILFSCSPRPSSSLGARPSEAGKCYAKVQYPTIYGQKEKSYVIYTGDDLNQEGIEVTYAEVSPEEKGWEKKKVDANCLSADPDDCLVWCMVVKPAIWDTIVQVRDTSLVKDYEIQSKIIEYPIQHHKVDWAEVHCEKQLKRSMVNKISMKLVELNYLANPTDKISKQLKAAIQNYQKDNDLAYGAMTVEFTDHLGI